LVLRGHGLPERKTKIKMIVDVRRKKGEFIPLVPLAQI